MSRDMESSVVVISVIVMLYSCCIFALENTTQSYQRLEDTRVDESIQQLDGLSVLQCGAACEIADTCVSLSYNSKANICRLNDRNPDSDVYCQMSSIPGWTSYYTDKSPCEDGWYHYDSSCYLHVQLEQDWETSEANCVTLDGYLVDILDNGEWQFLSETFIATFGEQWIGLNDQNEEGAFVWSSGSMKTIDKFLPADPNGDNSINCVTMLFDHDYGWLDEPCNDQFKSVCEREDYYF